MSVLALAHDDIRGLGCGGLLQSKLPERFAKMKAMAFEKQTVWRYRGEVMDEQQTNMFGPVILESLLSLSKVR